MNDHAISEPTRDEHGLAEHLRRIARELESLARVLFDPEAIAFTVRVGDRDGHELQLMVTERELRDALTGHGTPEKITCDLVAAKARQVTETHLLAADLGARAERLP